MKLLLLEKWLKLKSKGVGIGKLVERVAYLIAICF